MDHGGSTCLGKESVTPGSPSTLLTTAGLQRSRLVVVPRRKSSEYNSGLREELRGGVLFRRFLVLGRSPWLLRGRHCVFGLARGCLQEFDCVRWLASSDTHFVESADVSAWLVLLSRARILQSSVRLLHFAVLTVPLAADFMKYVLKLFVHLRQQPCGFRQVCRHVG